MVFSVSLITSFFYKYRYYLLVSAVLLSLGIFYYRTPLLRHLEAYALRTTQEQFGTKTIAPAHEAMIKEIADTMGIKDSIVIRKMNQKTLLAMGYYNAFAYFPMAFYCIPISKTPYLFISQGFFEDLTAAEQQFLIGHELAHIKERHLYYSQILLLLFGLVLLAAGWFIRKRIKLLVQNYSDMYRKGILIASTALLLIVCLVIPELIEAAYRKHIEYQADYISLTTLHSYEGCAQLFARWEKEFQLPQHNTYGGLFSSHPSFHERKKYCLELHNKSKDIA